MHTREEFSEIIDKYINELEFPENPKELYDPIAYTLAEGGKRLRPMILMMACDVFAKSNTEDALPCAAAIEVFHNFTLLHDDIMDNAPLRRGKTAVHEKWGKNIAILSGDAMVVFAYSLLQKTPVDKLPEVLAEFNKMAAEVCEGQQYDMDFENRDEVSLDEYLKMVRLKTAVIFASAAKIGAMIGGADKKDCEALYNFGIELGIAFQIQDDYLDTFGTPEVLGKQVGGDIEEAKKTFLAINALHDAGAATRRALLATFSDKNLPLQHKISRVKTIYNSLDIPKITCDFINIHLENASAELEKLSVGQEKVAELKRLIKSLSDRNN